MLLEPTKNKLKQWRVIEKSVNKCNFFSQMFWIMTKWMKITEKQICEDQIVTFKQSHILLYQGLLFLTRSTCVIVDAPSHTCKSHDFIPRYDIIHDTYLTIEVQGIRCTNHLHDSCPLTDVNPHFSAPGCRCYFKRWPTVTSSTHGPAASYWDVTMAHCSHGYLWTHDVVVGASWRDLTCEALSCLAHDFITSRSCLAHDFITLHIVVEWFITAHWETKQFIHVLG